MLSLPNGYNHLHKWAQRLIWLPYNSDLRMPLCFMVAFSMADPELSAL